MDRDASILFRLLGKGLRDVEPASEITGEFPDEAADREGWLRAQEDWNLPVRIAQHLRLKSRRYAVAATRLEGAEGPVVGLVLEVIEPTALDPMVFRRHVSRDVLTLIVKLLTAESAVRAARRIIVDIEPMHSTVERVV